MKRRHVFLSALVLVLGFSLAGGAAQAQELALNESSSIYSAELAAQSLSLCAYGQQSLREAMTDCGLSVVLEKNYDKSPEDTSHTCAYSVGMGRTTYQGEERTLLVVVIRGTAAGEWYSNFDFAPSHSDDTQFAENFLMAAQDVYLNLQSVLGQAENPLVLVTGHSRGAACANLLSLFLNAACGTENVFVYTFATPTTVRGAMAATECPNVFNLINPADLVTLTPPTGFGYTRLGTDVMLPGDETMAASLQASMDQLQALCPTIPSYYNVRHSLTGPGEGEDGVTVYEVLQGLALSLSGLSGQSTDQAAMPQVAETSDLAPLMQSLAALSDSDEAARVFGQHATAVYAQLLAAMN